MTDLDYNEYIYDYLTNNNTHSAIMLSAPWGTGKSYYIRNNLIPYLNEKIETKNKKRNNVIVVSLYGVSNIGDISKSIYFEYRFGKLRKKKEGVEITKMVGKTIIKGVDGYFNVDLNGTNDKDWEKLFKSLNLKNKLIILEDLERTNMSIIDVLGYISNLVEQEDAKVLVVANENEICKQYEIIEKDKEGKDVKKKLYTEESLEYFRVKEKTISDTINFQCSKNEAISNIMQEYLGDYYDVITDDSADNKKILDEILEVMEDVKSDNLRSLIYACQKTNDIFNHIDSNIANNFKRNIFLGIVAFALKVKKDSNIKWENELSGLNLGTYKYPILECAYNYIINQHMDSDKFKYEEKSFREHIEFEKKEGDVNKTLGIIYNYYISDEIELIQALTKLRDVHLKNKDIPISEYTKLANYLIATKKITSVENLVDECKNIMLENIKNQIYASEKPKGVHETGGGIQLVGSEVEEFNSFYEEMKKAVPTTMLKLYDWCYTVSSFESLLTKIKSDEEKYYDNGSFLKYVDIDKLGKLLGQLSAKQIYDFRGVILSIYRSLNRHKILSNDKEKLSQIKSCIDNLIEEGTYKDNVAKLQLSWLSENIKEIIEQEV